MVKHIEHYILNEHANNLYKKEAGSTFALAKDITFKINELIDEFNKFSTEKWEKIHEQDGKIYKAVLYMKDNLINSIHDLFVTLKETGQIDKLITKAVLDEVNKLLNRSEGTINVLEFGAIGNGTFDDTNAIKKAIQSGKEIIFPKGTFIVNEALNIPAKTIIKGSGRDTIIKGGSEAVLVLNGDHIVIQDLSIDGTGLANGINFKEHTYHFKLENLFITDCVKGLYDYQSLWMGEFSNINCKNCEVGFSFANNISKTSLKLNNCWCENCGTPYDFNQVNYSSLNCCGADYCNFITNSPYSKGYGSEDSAKGVYNFVLCKGLTMNSCGAENCYGNGIIKLGATSLVVNGLVATNIKSKWLPSYSTYPNYKVGDILLTAEKNKLVLNGYCFNSRFVNEVVKQVRPNDNQPIIAYNYSQATYGIQNNKSVIVSCIQDLGNVVFDGMGDYLRDCTNLDSNLNDMEVKSINVSGFKNFGCKKLEGNESYIINIPMISNSDFNYSHKLKISGIDNSKSNTPHAFFVEVAFASSSNVKQITILNSSEGISCEAHENNLRITLPFSYNKLLIECSAISDKIELIDWDNVSIY